MLKIQDSNAVSLSTGCQYQNRACYVSKCDPLEIDHREFKKSYFPLIILIWDPGKILHARIYMKSNLCDAFIHIFHSLGLMN